MTQMIKCVVSKQKHTADINFQHGSNQDPPQHTHIFDVLCWAIFLNLKLSVVQTEP